jgi:hypothetical protein
MSGFLNWVRVHAACVLNVQSAGLPDVCEACVAVLFWMFLLH